MRSTDGKRGFHFSFHSLVQRWPKQCVLGCVIPPLATHASSRNLGHTFLANSSGCDRKRTDFRSVLNGPSVLFLSQPLLYGMTAL